MNIFNSGYEKVGSLEKDLVLQTRGKVKIRYGKKFIDLLDNNGNLNVRIPKLKSLDSLDDIKTDGIYLVNGTIYVYISGELIALGGSNSGNISYENQQELTEDQILQAQKNIGLVYDSISDIKISNGIVIVNNELYKVVNKVVTPLISQD